MGRWGPGGGLANQVGAEHWSSSEPRKRLRQGPMGMAWHGIGMGTGAGKARGRRAIPTRPSIVAQQGMVRFVGVPSIPVGSRIVLAGPRNRHQPAGLLV